MNEREYLYLTEIRVIPLLWLVNWVTPHAKAYLFRLCTDSLINLILLETRFEAQCDGSWFVRTRYLFRATEMDILVEIWLRFWHYATFLNLDITIWSHVIFHCHDNTENIPRLKRETKALTAEILASETWNLWYLQGVSSHSAPLLYRDLNAKYGNNFLCVCMTFSLCGMEARKQESNLIDGNWKERMKEWRNELGILESWNEDASGACMTYLQ